MGEEFTEKLIGKNWSQSSIKTAEKAIRFLQQHQDWSLPDHGCILDVVRASPEEAFESVVQTRGIGPNPNVSSFNAFINELKKYFEVFTREINEKFRDQPEHLVVVLENYTLPGLDFDRSFDQETIDWVKKFPHDRITVVALRDSFDLPDTGALTTLCTYSFREESAIAAAKCLAGFFKNIRYGDAFI